jgi:hypothetical protein
MQVRYSSLFWRAVMPLDELPSILKAFTVVNAFVE